MGLKAKQKKGEKEKKKETGKKPKTNEKTLRASDFLKRIEKAKDNLQHPPKGD